MWHRLALIALAGALGTTARYSLGGFVQKLAGGDWPWGTLFVNVVGCFLFGLVWTLSDERTVISEESRIIVLGGFMGAFTTFSTFIFDTGGFIRADQWGQAGWHIMVQTGVGLLFLYLGVVAGRLG